MTATESALKLYTEDKPINEIADFPDAERLIYLTGGLDALLATLMLFSKAVDDALANGSFESLTKFFDETANVYRVRREEADALLTKLRESCYSIEVGDVGSVPLIAESSIGRTGLLESS